MSTTLYEDAFCRVDDLSITIYNYYIPSRKHRKILLEHVTVLFFESQCCTRFTVARVWGSGMGVVHWALDLKRMFARVPALVAPSSGGRSSRANVVLDIGNDMKIGFSVVDIDGFMEKMRECLDYHVIIVDKINL